MDDETRLDGAAQQADEATAERRQIPSRDGVVIPPEDEQ
jgi:hypothetical protein